MTKPDRESVERLKQRIRDWDAWGGEGEISKQMRGPVFDMLDALLTRAEKAEKNLRNWLR